MVLEIIGKIHEMTETSGRPYSRVKMERERERERERKRERDI